MLPNINTNLGNHDITLDPAFYDQHGLYFHNQCPQDSQACIALVKSYKSILYLNHESASVKVRHADDCQTRFKVFGSPYSPANGTWAFSYLPKDAEKVWDQSIPLDTDIVITHTPPKYHCDESRDRGAAGCEILRQKLWRIRPSLAICGHVHEGRGAERIKWDLETFNVNYKESSTAYWVDPGHDNKKQSLLDLTSKSSAPLQNSGPWKDEIIPCVRASLSTNSCASLLSWREKDFPRNIVTFDPSISQSDSVHGRGGSPPSGRCDIKALAGRQGRKETCIINAAMMASSWPYKSNNNRKYNKPIVVDLDLPIWKQQAESLIQDDDTGTTSDTTPSSDQDTAPGPSA